MKNRQHLTIKQVQRLQEAGVDLSDVNARWMKIDGEKPMVVSREFAYFMFLPDTIKENTICPAPTLSDLMSILPASMLTENNLRYLLSIQAAMTKEGVRYKAGYIVQPSEELKAQKDFVFGAISVTEKHDNPLDAAYELVMEFISENSVSMLHTSEEE